MGMVVAGSGVVGGSVSSGPGGIIVKIPEELCGE